MYHKKMIDMWASRYIEKARQVGNKLAQEWVTKFVPRDAHELVKKSVEATFDIKR